MKQPSPAYYARPGGRPADLWTLLHPPYTAWNLAYVAIGAALAPTVHWPVLAALLAAFFCGTGIAAHALDELHGHPLRTGFTESELKLLAGGGLGLSFVLALWAAWLTTPVLLLFYGVGACLVLAYNLEWWAGLIHTDLGFALSWGAFPVIVGYWSQTGAFSNTAVAAAGAATLLSLAQRSLSTQARFLRRRVTGGAVRFTTAEQEVRWDLGQLLATWERPLKLLSWAVVSLAIGLLIKK